MKHANAELLVRRLLAQVDVHINGNRIWDLKVDNAAFFTRVLAGGSLALGESYMDGWWRCEALDQFFDKVLSARLDQTARRQKGLFTAVVKAKLFNAQRGSKAYVIGRRHYDIGNDLFRLMLDKRMNYSCGYWENASTLDEAQQAKLDLTCRKLRLKPGMAVLDIGCGWGGFARWAAEKYGVSVVGVTVSREQADFAGEYCRGLPVNIALQDYRSIDRSFERIVSIGMFEHVGFKNYRRFMQVVNRCLTDDGLFLLHTIARNTTASTVDPWIGKYIFPNSMLPSARQIASAAEGLLVLEDWHSFGPSYDKTLMAWHANLARNRHKIIAKYDERFFRMWTYYLLSCAGGFRSRRNQLWQIVFSKSGLRTGYRRC